MEYVSMFIWLVLCLTLGGTIHAILGSAHSTGWLKWLAAPGVAVRKFGMALAAMLTGATVTNVNIYRVSERDIGFDGQALGGLPRFIVPVAPLFIGALVLRGANSLLGTPMNLDLTAPQMSSLSASGAEEFFTGLWSIITGLTRSLVRGEWNSLGFYVFLALAFSLAMGAGAPFAKYRDSLIGCLLLVIALAVVCGIFGVPRSTVSSIVGTGPAAEVVLSMRKFLLNTAHAALIMMTCGILLATAVGIIVRLFELFTRSSSTSAPSREQEAI